jgi:hypothetical protein
MRFEYNYPRLDQNILQMVFRISLVNALRGTKANDSFFLGTNDASNVEMLRVSTS